MPLHEVLKEMDSRLYPDIAKAGSLNVAIYNSLTSIGSHLVADVAPVDDFMPYGRVEEGSRFSQIHLAGGQRLFLFDFWSEGVLFGSASSDNLLDVARSIHTWIAEKSS